MISPLPLLLALAVSPALAGEPAKGKELYLRSCSQCHGDKGDGKGPAAERMFTKPRDLTTGAYKIRTTPNGEIPTDEDLARAISEGLPGSTMPAWKGAYGRAEIADLVAYIKTFSDRFSSEKPSKVYSLTGAKRATPESIADGRKLYLEMQCNSCHGMEGRADGPSAPTDDSGNPIRPANFQKAWKLRGGHRVEDIFRTILTGLNGTPMPAYVDALGDNPEGYAKAWDLANYVLSLSSGKPALGEVLRAQGLEGELPASPEDPAWKRVKATGFPLFGQIMEEPRQFEASIDFLSARGLYNQEELALLLEWDDPIRDPQPEQKAPDSVQIQTPLRLYPESQAGERPYFLVGDSSHPVNLWRWDSKTDKALSLKSTGLSSTKTPLPGVFVSSSAYSEGRWRLLVRRKIKLAGEEGLSLTPGVFVPIAFSAWDASSGDAGSKRSVSSWYYLLLEPPRPKTLYAAPLAAFFVVGGLELWFLSWRRKRKGGKTHV